MKRRRAATSRQRVTSVHVAAEAGVSQATVTRVFSSPSLVSEATRTRVETAASRLEYRPNAIARSLRQQRTNIVGAVVPAGGEYWQHVLTAFSRRLAADGRQLLLFSFPDGGTVDEVLATVDQFWIDGLLLASASITPSQLAAAHDRDLPVVAFNQPAASGIVPSVSVDNAGGMQLVARHLVDEECRTALFVGGDQSVSTDQHRYRGAAREFGDAVVACPYLEAGSFSYEAGYQAGGHIADRPDLPDALVVAGDELAFGVIDGLRAAGVTAPDDVRITGFDGLPQTTWAGYDLTTIVQPIEALVNQTVDLLIEPRADPIQRPGDFVTAGTLRIGGSSRRSPLQP